MLMVCMRRPLLAIGLALTLALTPALLAAPGVPDTKEKAVSPAEKIKKQLDATISLEVTEQSLTLALNQIREHTKINFVIDRFTMQQMGMDPEQMPVNVKLKDVKVRTCLRSVLGPYNLGYAIIGDTILVSTDEMVMLRQMHQRVSIDLEKVDLAKALKQLSRETATNVMLDSRVKEKDTKAEITLQMEDVPLETAVRLVCEMAGLKPVKVGNVLFVTTKVLANEMRADPDLAQPGVPGNPGYPQPGQPGFPQPNVLVPPPPPNAPGGAAPATVPVPNVEKPDDHKQLTDPDKKPDDKKPDDKKPTDDAPKKDKPEKDKQPEKGNDPSTAKPTTEPPSSEPKPAPRKD